MLMAIDLLRRLFAPARILGGLQVGAQGSCRHGGRQGGAVAAKLSAVLSLASCMHGSEMEPPEIR